METARAAVSSGRAANAYTGTLKTRAAATVADAHASVVDREPRFPAEAFAQIRKHGLLGTVGPEALGGEGASLADIVDVCFTLGQSFALTGMIYAMHQIKMACLVRDTHGHTGLEKILRRVVTDQLRMASSTTEGQGGGNERASEAPVERDGEKISLERKAAVISCGAAADGIVTTTRRAAGAAASDQVLLVFQKADCTLEPLQGWDTLGKCGTCSEGFTQRAKGTAESIGPEPYEKIHAQTMLPFAHLTWGAVWTGVAAAATPRAQAFIRHANGQLPPGALHFTDAVYSLRTLRGILASSLRSYEYAMGDEKALTSLEFRSTITLKKVQASELTAGTAMSAMRACGLSGYRNDGELSIGRHLRQVLSSPIMINNDRILANLATPSLMTPLPSSISS